MRLIVTWDGRALVAARMAAGRPLAARILAGRHPEEVVGLVPRLFSLCGQAQGVAARLALRAAQRQPVTACAVKTALRSVALEAIGEHLWRLLLDWPPMLGGPARKAEFLSWRQRLSMAEEQVAAVALGSDLQAWLQREISLPLDLPAVGQPARLLPWLTAEAWAQLPMDEAFALRPVWSDGAAETGPLARQSSRPEIAALRTRGATVAARIAARYADLHDLARGLVEPEVLSGWVEAAPAGRNGGLARVETARGVLLHRVEICGDRIGRYLIVAPTEWNFHPQGAFFSEIVGLRAATREQAEATVRHLALSLDPCVGYEVELV